MATNYLLAADVAVSSEPDAEIFAVKWAADGVVATAGLKGVARVWDAADQEAPCRLELPSQDHLAVVGLDIDPAPSQPQYLVTSSLDSVLCRWSIAGDNAGKLAARQAMPPAQSWDVALHPSTSANIMLTAGGGAKGHVLKSSVDGFGDELATLEGRGQFAMCCCYSPDGTLCAIGTDSGQVSIFEADTGQLTQSFPAHANVVRALTFSPDSSMIITGSDDKRIHAYDLRRSPHANRDGGPRRGGGQVLSLAGHEGWVTSISCRSDGRVIASASADGTVKIWDLQRPQGSLSTLKDSEREVWAIDWRKDVQQQQVVEGVTGIGSPAGGALVTGGADGQLRWYRATGR